MYLLVLFSILQSYTMSQQEIYAYITTVIVQNPLVEHETCTANELNRRMILLVLLALDTEK